MPRKNYLDNSYEIVNSDTKNNLRTDQKKDLEYSHAEVEKNGPETKDGIIVGSLFVNMRADPIAGSYVLKTLRKDDHVKIWKKVENYYKVSTTDGIMGYILCDYINKEE